MNYRSLVAASALALSACHGTYGPTGEVVVAPPGSSEPDAGMMEMPGSPDSGMSAMPVDPGPVMDLPRDPACPAQAIWISRIRGTILDETANPLPAVKAQACVRVAIGNGALVCLRPVDTDASGQFVLDIPEEGRCVLDSTMRLVLPSSARAVGYCPLSAPASGSEIRMAAPLRMYGTRPATELPPAGDTTARRTVRFEGGLELSVVPHEFFAEYDKLSAVRISPRATGLCFLEGEAPFDGILAFSPEGAADSPISLRIPNSTNIAAGRRVRIFYLGALGCLDENRAQVPEGRWLELDPAVVSADGQFIDVNSGTGCLSWIAYRAE